MSYFSDWYESLKYPKQDKGRDGLRNAQLGAIHAIASQSTLVEQATHIIVMPTGTGKTAVFMMAPYVLARKKVLIVTPNVMVRGQIYDDFRFLRTLKRIGVFDNEVLPPNVYELKEMYSEKKRTCIQSADVVIGTPQVSLSLSLDKISRQFDYVIVDESHHVPAKTWKQILENMNQADHLLVTATPFRLDRKEIKGQHIYTYPLSLAYKDGIFGEVTYIPIEEGPDKDKLIAIEAERVYINDRSQGLNHSLLVRTNTKSKARDLEAIYKELTNLKLMRIDSSFTYKTIQRTLEKLKSKEIDGIICVDMLGEGYDFPNLKIAALHEPHRSLASTLQFIGRFSRTNAPNIGTAKFIAMNDEDLLIENRRIFSNDAIWQEIIVDLSEKKNQAEASYNQVDKDFFKPDNPSAVDLSLFNIRPNCHAKVYRVKSFQIENNFPSNNYVEVVFRDYSTNTLVALSKNKTKPIWVENAQVWDISNLLFIVHFQKSTSLLFIYSQINSESSYFEIASSFAEKVEKIPRNEMNRVLGNMTNYEFFNTGMQNRYSEDGESYRIYSGSNTAASIDETTGKMRSAGHAFCKATKDETNITIGYSSGSKIWSSKYLKLPDYINWCDECGSQIDDDKIIVRTNTNYDLLPLPKKLSKFPENVCYCFFSDRTYSSAPPVFINGCSDSPGVVTDILIKVDSILPDKMNLYAEISGITEILSCDVEGNYDSTSETILVRNGVLQQSLADYLSSNPLQFKTTDDTIIQGSEILTGDPASIIYSDEHIHPIDWISHGTDVRLEFGKEKFGKKAIHDVLQAMLLEKSEYNFIINDHGTGEIADFITVSERESEVEVSLFHVKAMKGKKYNSALDDIYEVMQQAIKSVIWLPTKTALLQKITDRRRIGKSIFVKGSLESLKATLRADKLLVANIFVVQPSISKSQTMPDKYKEVLASGTFYLKQSGRVKALTILGSP